MNDRFEYRIDIEENVDLTVPVPKMILLNFAENAVKHGIRHLEREGEIDIVIKKKQNKIMVTIEDNGIGRKQSSILSSEGTGKGLEITDTILALYKELKKIRITYQIQDLLDNENRPRGTLVTILIPLS
jgi:sensor histidine kinase YesM